MTQWHANPFLVGYFDGKTSVISLTTAPESATFLIHEPDHPLRGVVDSKGLLQAIPRMRVADVTLLEASSIISKTQFDRERMISEQLEANHDPTLLRLTVVPTLNCNFSCSYCYQQHSGQRRMNDSVYGAIFRCIRRKIVQGVRDVRIMLFGGEPLMLARHWMPWLGQWRRHCLEAGVQFSAKATTNGYLLRDPAVTNQVLTSGCTNFQITLDGTQVLHNLTRPSRRGRATYMAVVAGLRNLAAHPDMTSCTIRINHSRATVAPTAMHAFLQDVVEITGKDDRFRIDHQRAADLGGTVLQELPYDEFAAMLPSLKRLTHESGLKPVRDSYPGDRACYASSRNSLVVMPDGRLAKCTVAFNDSRNHVGYLREDGSVVLNEKLEKWVTPSLAQKCLSCVHMPQCRGGACPLGNLSGKSVCPEKLLDLSYLALRVI